MADEVLSSLAEQRRALAAEKVALQRAVDAETARGGAGPKWERASQVARSRGAEIDRAIADISGREKAHADQAAKLKRQADAAPWVVASSLAALPVGIVAGVKLSKFIEGRHDAYARSVNTELKGLAAQAETALPKRPRAGAKVPAANNHILRGVLNAAKRLDLARVARGGPVGYVSAGLIAGEGLLARYDLAPRAEDERVKAVVGAVGTASLFASSNLIGERMIQRATPKVLLDTKSIATLETARSVIGKGAPALPPSVPPAAKAGAKKAAAMTAGRLALRAVPVVGWAALAYGVGSNIYKSVSTGGSPKDVAMSALRGAIGLDAVTSKPTGEARLTSARGTLARAAAARAAAGTGSSAMRSARTVARAVRSDGMTDAHTRVVNGKAVQVKGYNTAPRPR